MKSKFYYIIPFFLFFLNSSSQIKDIELIEEKKNDTIKIYLKNNLSESVNVNLTITGDGYKKNANTINKTILGKETKEFISLIPNSKKNISYKVNFSYKVIKEEKKPTTFENQNYSNDLFDLNSIVVFTKKGCSRSKKTIDYLNFNNIKFIELNTTDNKENAEIMWKKINPTKPISITYPVIVINNKLTHSHKDLDLFLKQIK